MSRLLFLSHRIPYPPDKGDKIRSYHLLMHLAQRHDVFLGAFVDDERDWQHADAVAANCKQTRLVRLHPTWGRIRSLRAFASGEPLSVQYYASSEMKQWVDETVDIYGIDRAIVFSSTMAQYLSGSRYRGLHRVADFCDVDSDKWRQYAEGKGVPMNRLYGREARAMLGYERRVAAEFDATLFVSEDEAALFRRLAPETAGKVGFFDNGVDARYFDPRISFPSPYGSAQGSVTVFTGAMDYWANIDAVTWFVHAVWPLVQAQVPLSSFWIVGSNPTAQVRALDRCPGVRVTGRVADVRPYLAHAGVAVAPMRIARGTQNKILEALAMARPVACTPAAASGLRIERDEGFRVAAEPQALAAAVLDLHRLGANPQGREAVLAQYSWNANLASVDELLTTVSP